MSLRERLGSVRWYLREITGEAGYDKYLERHGREHPDEPPLSRRAFERRRVDRGDADPGARCC